MDNDANIYLMESAAEETRLEWKTDLDILKSQALWCGMRPGLRVLDAGCGTGKTSSLFFDLVQPGGEVVGIDYSEKRINYAREHYGKKGLTFRQCDLTKPINGSGKFDIIWIRFVLEYFLAESPLIVKHLSEALNPGGCLCLLDLDHNSANHYALPGEMEKAFGRLMAVLSEKFNFDPYCGRKLYSYLYDLGFADIEVNLTAHHLIYGRISDVDAFNWRKKLEVAAVKARSAFEGYPGGYESYFSDFQRFFADPRRFTYTPLIMCKGRKA